MQAKALIIVEKQSQVEELLCLARSRQHEADLTLFAPDDTVAGKLDNSNIRIKTGKDYGLSDEYLQKTSIEWYRSFADKETGIGENIKELLVYKNISLWWLVEQQLYISRFAFPRLRDTIQQVIILDRIIQAEKPAIIYYADNGTVLSTAIRFVCKSGGIDTAISAGSSRIKRRLINKFRAFAYINGLWLRLFLRKICWALARHKKLSATTTGKKKLLIFSVCVWSNIRSLKSGKLIKGDPYLDSVIELGNDEMEALDVDTPGGEWGLSIMKEKSKQEKMGYKPFEGYLAAGIILKAFRAAIRLNKDYKRLVASRGFRQSFSYNKLPMYNLARQNFSLFFSTPHLALMITFIEIAKRMIITEDPAVIIHYGDLPDSGRAVIAAAKAKSIPVILLQHGLYENWNPYFNHIGADIGTGKEATAPYCPIPDKFAMSDVYTRDILIERGKFKDEDIAVTGQPRYDVMNSSYNILKRKTVFETLGLDPAKKLVVWTTASHSFSPRENGRFISGVCNAINALSNTQLLIKLHPGENQKAPLYHQYQNLKPIIVGKYGLTTFELLNAADVVIINGWCSTGIEAIILDKPVISMEFEDIQIAPYVKCGAAINANGEEAVATALKSILSSKKILTELEQARKRYIDELGYKTDGQASQRVADIIKQMAK